MRILAISALREFSKEHPDAEIPLRSWYAAASRADWRSPAAVKASYRNASIIANNRVVFNIKGNDYTPRRQFGAGSVEGRPVSRAVKEFVGRWRACAGSRTIP